MINIDKKTTLVRALGGLGHIMIVTAVAVFLFVGYQLWGTSIQESQAQSNLQSDFDALLESVGTAPATTTSSTPSAADTTTTSTAQNLTPTSTTPRRVDLDSIESDVLSTLLVPTKGAVIVRLDMPTIDVSKHVVEGAQVADLRKGPGHYQATSLPGFAGNSGIAGHRTTYGQPFHDIDRLLPGDMLTVVSPVGTFAYEVLAPEDAYGQQLDDVEQVHDGHVIVEPGATWVLGDFGDDRITLTACHPKFSARQRIVVAARLVGEPADAPPLPPEAPEIVELADEDQTTVTDDRNEDDRAATTQPPVDDGGPTEEQINEVTLDEGLDGDGSALLPAVLWGVAVAVIYVLANVGFRRWNRLGSIGLAVVPLALALWFCFEQVDKLLPAY